VPNARRIGVLWNPAFPSHHQALKALETAGAKLDVQLHTVEAEDPDRFDEAFATLARQHVAAGLVVNSTIYLKHAERLGKLALRHRLPVMFGSTWHVHAGGFISYGPNVNTLVRRSAAYIDKILRGRKPADLPVEQAATFELAVNLKTAKALGIAVPQSILIRADEVIQ
jgi:putative ABC transport system substrate-binding protein